MPRTSTASLNVTGLLILLAVVESTIEAGFKEPAEESSTHLGKSSKDAVEPSGAFATESPCYHGNSAKAKFCEPQFENLAVNRRVDATSSCGSPPSHVCRREIDGVEICELCDSSQPKLSHPASHLTDYHVHGSCWISGPIKPSSLEVNLTLRLGKKHTVYYASLTDCGAGLPDSIEAYRSADSGATWLLWHLFSNNCSGDYPGGGGGNYQYGPTEVVCSDTSQLESWSSYKQEQQSQQQVMPPQQQHRNVLSFSTNFNRAVHLEGQTLAVAADWMLATDIRLVMRRRARPRRRVGVGGGIGVGSDFFAFSNLDIGGRCFCNGHAARCVPDAGSSHRRVTCECEHGTEGEDCERCRPFWVDAPWRRASATDPAECRRCDCNGHTDRCQFDASTHRFSSSSSIGITGSHNGSGGVCLSCKHNTAGRNCQYCRPGYHRNWNSPINSTRVCTLCNCHPLGSSTSVCDRDTGRCVCKLGVEGDKCDRCLTGFEQTTDPQVPCRRPAAMLKTPAFTPGPSVVKPRRRQGVQKEGGQKATMQKRKVKCPKKCGSDVRWLTLKQFVTNEWAMSFFAHRVTRQRHWIRVSGTVQQVIRRPPPTAHSSRPKDQSLVAADGPPSQAMMSLMVRRRLWKCGCPGGMRPGVAYLIIARDRQRSGGRGGGSGSGGGRRLQLVLDKRAVVWHWEADLMERLQRLQLEATSARRGERSYMHMYGGR